MVCDTKFDVQDTVFAIIGGAVMECTVLRVECFEAVESEYSRSFAKGIKYDVKSTVSAQVFTDISEQNLFATIEEAAEQMLSEIGLEVDRKHIRKRGALA